MVISSTRLDEHEGDDVLEAGQAQSRYQRPYEAFSTLVYFRRDFMVSAGSVPAVHRSIALTNRNAVRHT